jgi:ubiquinone/menaquinone biosynthesis C-methylase UbiE
MSNEYFDKAAATWDDNPARRAISVAVADAIRQVVHLGKKMLVLDYGCGTGLLSFLLAGDVGGVLAADSSDGMLEQVRKKIAGQGVKNVRVMRFDVTEHGQIAASHDLVVSAMTMHHIGDVQAALSGLAAMLKPGGWLAIADLCTEDGSFHQDVKVPHNGFEPDELARRLKDIGMREVSWQVVHEVEKNSRQYPVFCVFAKKAAG